MIGVKGFTHSKYFTAPPHLYKYGETIVAFCLKDQRIYWRQLSSLLSPKIDSNEEEALFKFTVDKLSDISKVVKCVMKKGSSKLSVNFTQTKRKAS